MLARLLLLALLVSAGSLPSGAQSLDARPLDALSAVPSWAAPAAPAPGPAPSERVPGGPGGNPGTPGSPGQVPADGGLGLLALAGAGYAARRLRQR